MSRVTAPISRSVVDLMGPQQIERFVRAELTAALAEFLRQDAFCQERVMLWGSDAEMCWTDGALAARHNPALCRMFGGDQ